MQVRALIDRDKPKGPASMIRNVLTAAALAALTLTTAACNTVDGIGDDIKSVGQAGKRAID